MVRWLQSVDIPALAFVVCEAKAIVPGYSVELASSELECIGISDAADAEIYAILRYLRDPAKMTANLLAPIILNRAAGLARQVVLSQTEYSSSHKVFPHLKGRGNAAGGEKGTGKQGPA